MPSLPNSGYLMKVHASDETTRCAFKCVAIDQVELCCALLHWSGLNVMTSFISLFSEMLLNSNQLVWSWPKGGKSLLTDHSGIFLICCHMNFSSLLALLA